MLFGVCVGLVGKSTLTMFGEPKRVEGPTFKLAQNATGSVKFSIVPVKNVHLNGDAPNKYEVKTSNASIIKILDTLKVDLVKGESTSIDFEKIVEGDASI